MKKLLLISVLAASLAACGGADKPSESSADANVSSGDKDAQIAALQKDVAEMRADLYGVQLGTCGTVDYLAGPESYAAALEGLPEEKLTNVDWHKANAERDGVMTTQSGLQYTVVKPGAGGAKAKETDFVKVHYYGFFRNGEMFDSSYSRGRPSEFRRNQVVPGWIEALGDMTMCEARTVYVPGALAYGAQGRKNQDGSWAIKPDETLIFHVQLLNITEKKGLIKK